MTVKPNRQNWHVEYTDKFGQVERFNLTLPVHTVEQPHWNRNGWLVIGSLSVNGHTINRDSVIIRRQGSPFYDSQFPEVV